jgi:hypothetical protein
MVGLTGSDDRGREHFPHPMGWLCARPPLSVCAFWQRNIMVSSSLGDCISMFMPYQAPELILCIVLCSDADGMGLVFMSRKTTLCRVEDFWVESPGPKLA